MTDLATLLVEDAVKERDVQITKKALKKGLSINDISEITGLDESTIMRIQEELDNE